MAGSMDSREKRLAELRREVNKRGFDRHASALKSVSELPIEFQTRAVLEMASRETIQPIILFPPQILRGWDYVPKQALLFTTAGVIHLMGSIWQDEGPQATYLNGHDLLYLKVTLILLYGYLEIVAQGQGSPVQLGIEFNTVAWSHLDPPLRRLLQAAITSPEIQTKGSNSSPAIQQALRALPIKFANGAKIYGSLPNEQLEELVFQPVMWKRWFFILKQTIIANTLLLLSSHYVIVIQEDEKVSLGWILTYLPRDRIVEIQNQPHDLYHELIFKLKRGDQEKEYTIRLKSETVADWHSRWTQHGGQWRDLPGRT